jgi:hypothetical protein
VERVVTGFAYADAAIQTPARRQRTPTNASVVLWRVKISERVGMQVHV